MTTEELNEQVAEICKEYGVTKSTSSFKDFTVFKMEWLRTGDWMWIQFPDYLEDAPNEICISLLRSILNKIFKSGEIEYEDSFKEYIRSNEFVSANIPLFMKRCKVAIPEKENVGIRAIASECGFDGIIGWTKYKQPRASAIFCIILIPICYNDVQNAKDVETIIKEYVGRLNKAKLGLRKAGV